MPTTHASAAAPSAMIESALAPPPPPSTLAAPSADAYRHHTHLPLSPGQPARRFAAGKSKTGRQSSKFGTVNYSVDEMRRLNENVRAVMPIAGEDWLHVAYKFNYMRPESIPYREVDSLKRKFKKMYCSRASTAASGKLPDYIDEAKELRRLINLRTEKAQLDASDSHSELDAQDVATGFEPQQQVAVSAPAAADAAVQSGKTETALASSGIETTTHAAGTGSSDRAQRSGAPGDRQRSPFPQDPVSGATQPPGIGAVPLVTPPDVRPLIASSSHAPAAAAAATSFAPQQQDEHVVPDAAPETDMRALASKLSAMEDAYRESLGAKRTSSHDTVERLMPAAAASPSSATSLAAPAQSLSDLLATAPVQSTSSVIAMLQQSIERKRRTIEDDVLSESERVRKERKKRKMEQVLLAIHHEQRERELLLTPAATTASQMPHATVAAMPLRTPAPLPLLASSPSTSERLLPVDATASVGVLEIVLQFLVAQQREHAAQLQQLRDERERERELQIQRRRGKERRRRREMRDLMLVMATALGDAFPDALKHHLALDPSLASHGDDDDLDTEDLARRAVLTEARQQQEQPPSST